MTQATYGTVSELAASIGRSHRIVSYWHETGKLKFPTDRVIFRGTPRYNIDEYAASYSQYMQKIFEEKQEKQKKEAPRPVKIKPEKQTSTTQRATNRGQWSAETLKPIKLPEIMTESDMGPYRELGWSMLLDAVLDQSPVAGKGRHSTNTTIAELSTNNAKRWLAGENDPEMLSLACSLAGVSEAWVKERVNSIEVFPSRSEMKKMLSTWRAHQYELNNYQVVAGRLQCYMDFGDDDISEVVQSTPNPEPVYAFSGVQKKTKKFMTRQHNRQTAVAP